MLQLRIQDNKIQQPSAGEGVATYAVWASSANKPGLAFAKNVKKSCETFFVEEITANAEIRYRATKIGDIYKIPPNGGNPPYSSILSVPMTRLLSASSNPFDQPSLECIGVLNLTSPNRNDFDNEDFAWAQCCASLLGSMHSSLFDQLDALADAKGVREFDANDVLLRELNPGHKKSVDVGGNILTEVPASAEKAVTMTIGKNRITPWVTLSESQYLVKCERIGEFERQAIIDKVSEFGIALVRLHAQAAREDVIVEVAQLLGVPAQEQNQAQGSVKLIRPVHEKPGNTGDSAKALGAHVDGSQQNQTPPVLLFQYVDGAAYGARSQFWDASHFFHEMEPNERRKVLRILAKPRIATFKKGADKFEGPIIRIVGSDSVAIRFRVDDVMSVQPEAQDVYEKLKARLQQRSLEYLPVRGDVAVFDNWRLLHGRTEVGGEMDRGHRRIWIENVHPDSNLALGIRPIDLDTMVEIRSTSLK